MKSKYRELRQIFLAMHELQTNMIQLRIIYHTFIGDKIHDLFHFYYFLSIYHLSFFFIHIFQMYLYHHLHTIQLCFLPPPFFNRISKRRLIITSERAHHPTTTHNSQSAAASHLKPITHRFVPHFYESKTNGVSKRS